MTVSEIQTKILNETGVKTSVKKYSKGSMNGYIRIIPIFQNGSYPNFPFDFVRNLKDILLNYDSASNPVLCSVSDICVYGIEDDRLYMKKENKPKPVDVNKVMKGWGSKNSQIRLDKAISRNAKKMRKGGVATYM